MFFGLKGENFNGNAYAETALENGARYTIIDDPEFDILNETILVEDVLMTLQQLAAFHRRYLKTTIIALTGSNGKTTTKELINSVLSQKYITIATIGNLNNHIGVPLTLLSMNEKTEIGIVEMGANHLDEIKFLCKIAKPDYGYITNFGKAHLEGFGSLKGVIKGKSEMYDFLIKKKKFIFVNGNDPIQVDKTKESKRYIFGDNNETTDISINFIEAQPYVKCTFENLELKSQLIGDYNFNNISAAIAIGSYFKVDNKTIKTAIENYIPTNNRSQIIQKNSNKIILDAYNANPTSMRAALLNFEKLAGFKIAILGDMFELGNDAEKEHQEIINLAETLNLNSIYFIGKNFYKTKITFKHINQFETFDDFKNHFDFSQIESTTLLIKGSRGMALERVLNLQ